MRNRDSFKGMGEKPTGKTCKAMKGLIEEGKEIIEEDGDGSVLDAALIGAAFALKWWFRTSSSGSGSGSAAIVSAPSPSSTPLK